MPEISVIVPSYKSEKTLNRCIDSILSQTLKDIEVIIVDDGSPDNALIVARKIASKDSRVKAYTKNHAGVSAARNYGIKKAHGKYIQFVDSDDFIEHDMLEKMYNMAEKEHADIAVCNFTHPSIQGYIGNCVLDFSKREDMLFYHQCTFSAHLPWNKLFLRKIITEPFDEDIHFCEDGLFNLANMFNAKKAVCTDEVLYHYYCAPPQASGDEASCINKIAQGQNFWETKKTFWYMLDALVPKMSKILEKNKISCPEDFIYARVFDFMPWELIILGAMGIDEYGLTKEMQQIFREKDFLYSLKLKEKYGLRFTPLSEKVIDNKVADFVHISLESIRYCLDTGLKVGEVVMGIFVYMFMEVCGELDSVDILSRYEINLEMSSSEEWKYVNTVCVGVAA